MNVGKLHNYSGMGVSAHNPNLLLWHSGSGKNH